MSPEAILKEFESISSLENQEIVSYLPKNCIPIGYFCPYVPEELIHAAGGLPFRLMGSPIRLAHSPAHLPPTCCHLVKSSLESLLQGDLDFLKGVIFTHTCDAMKGLSETFAFQKRIPFQFNFMMPSHMNSDHALSFLKQEIVRLKTFLEANVGAITPHGLRTSIRLFNQMREKVQRLYDLMKQWPDWISGSGFASVIRAGYLLDRGRYVELLTKCLDEFPRDKEGKSDYVPVYLAGNMVHSPVYFSMIEEAGARVVSDDLCSGARFLRLKTREDIDPTEALAERYLTRFLCPSKHKGPQAHLETLLTEVEKSGARGVIFLLYKYCETHFFDYPDLKSTLESKGIPSLLLEVEDPSYSIGQLKIRIQAFVEMLSPI